jgi:type VII secretion protein EccB
MASRKDQLHSYQFMLQRSISALVMRETDPAVSPLRRGVGAAFVGVMVAVIVAASFGIYGLLTKTGASKWQQDNAVIVERETGRHYVYTGKLTPTSNLASAMLLAGKSPPTKFTVSRNSLKGVLRESLRGIPDAPDGIPGPKDIESSAWSLCAQGNLGRTGETGTSTQVILKVGQSALHGRKLADNTALLVSDQNNKTDYYMISRGYRHRIYYPDLVLHALYGNLTPLPNVGTAWIDGIPEGTAIFPIAPPNRGARSVVRGRKVGDVLFVPKKDATDYYLVQADGLAVITPMQLQIYQGQVQVKPIQVGQPSLANVPTSRIGYGNGATDDYYAPTTTPTPATTSKVRAMCAVYESEAMTPTMVVDADQVSPDLTTETGARTGMATPLADRVFVRSGRGAVIRTAESNAYSIVTDNGIRYPVADAEALGCLGMPADRAVVLPALLVNRLPTGPTLSKTAAAAAAVPRPAPN